MAAGLVPYAEAWAWQKRWVAARKQSPELPDLLCLLEHPAVYTLGQASDMAFVKFAAGEYELVRIERGGGGDVSCAGAVGGVSDFEFSALSSGFALVFAAVGGGCDSDSWPFWISGGARGGVDGGVGKGEEGGGDRH